MMRGSRADVIWPNAGLFIVAVGRTPLPGLRKRAWLNALNISARKSIFCASVTGKVLESAISAFHAPGPRSVLRPSLPYTPQSGVVGADAPVGQFSAANAFTLNHC